MQFSGTSGEEAFRLKSSAASSRALRAGFGTRTLR